MGVLMLAVDAAAVHDCGRRRRGSASSAAAASPPLEVKKEPDDEPYWMAMAPPPKKKWIRHYLRTEEEPSSTGDAAAAASPALAPAASRAAATSPTPPPPTPPPPPPPPPPAVATVRAVVPLPPPPPLPAPLPLVHQLPPTHVHHLQLAPPHHSAAAAPAPAAASVSVVVPAPVAAPAPVPAPAAPAPAAPTPPPAHAATATTTVPSVVVNGGLSPMETSTNSEDAKDFHKRTMGTREVHNKLEKNRRAHLKECFELLKKQLPPSPDEKKTSNLSILHSALRYIQVMRRKEREFEHEMERLAREKIAAQQRLANLKKELSAQWDHIDFNALLPETVPVDNDPVRPPRDTVSHTASTASAGADLSDGEEPLHRSGPMYSSTSSLSSTATPGSPQPQQHATEDATQTQQQSPRPTGVVTTPPHQHALPPPPPTHHLQLPVSAHMVSAAPGLAAALVSPTIQLLASSGLRVLPAEPQPLSLTVHHPQSSSHHHAGVGTDRLRESPTSAAISLPTLHLTNKMVALPGGAELNLLPANGTRKHPSLATITGGISLPNGVLGPHHPVQHTATATQHTTHHHTGVTLATKSMPAGITHVVAPLGSHPAHTGLTPLVTPVTVVSQGSQQVAHILATPQPIGAAGKVMTTAPLLKSVGPMPLVNAQYLSAAALVKPVVVVSSPSQASALPPPHTTS